MEMKDRVLTDKQQAVWDLKQQGMTKKAIAETLGISVSMVTSHLNNADRRFREYERYLAFEEKNNQVVDIKLTRGELDLIVHALGEYERYLMKQAHYNVKTDWRGRLPFGAEPTQALYEKVQMHLYGEVMYKSLLAEGTEEDKQE